MADGRTTELLSTLGIASALAPRTEFSSLNPLRRRRDEIGRERGLGAIPG